MKPIALTVLALASWTSSALAKPATGHLPDPDRDALLIGASLGVFFGTAATGAAFLSVRARAEGRWHVDPTTGTHSYEPGRPGLAWAAFGVYAATIAVVPSIPRYALGDVGRGLLFTSCRLASLAVTVALATEESRGGLASFSDKTAGLVLFGLVAPVTLAIVDLAMTPHREDLVRRVKPTRPSVSGLGIAPVAGGGLRSLAVFASGTL